MQADRRQARDHRVSDQGRGRDGTPRGRNRLRARGRAAVSKHHVSTTINGEPTEFLCDAQLTLLDVLRDQLQLTGSKEGCSSGDCGACSVTLDGRLVCSCLILAVEAEGRAIETIEGMARGHELH